MESIVGTASAGLQRACVQTGAGHTQQDEGEQQEESLVAHKSSGLIFT